MATVEMTTDELRSRPSRATTPCWSTSGRRGAARAVSSRPVFEQASETNPDLVFAKVDTEAQQDLAAAFGIQSIPTLMIFRENVVVFSQPGALPDAALEDLIGQVRALDMEKVHASVAEHNAEHADHSGHSH